MPRTGETFAFDGTILNWAAPTVSQNLSISGWNALRNDLADALTGSVARAGGTMTGPLNLASGVVASPGLRFAANPNDGLYRAGSNLYRWCINTNDIFEITSTQLRLRRAGVYYTAAADLGYGSYRLPGAGAPIVTAAGPLTTWTSLSEDAAGSFTVNLAAGTITINVTGVYEVGFYTVFTVTTDIVGTLGIAVGGTLGDAARVFVNTTSIIGSGVANGTSITPFTAADVLTLRWVHVSGAMAMQNTNIFIRRIA